MGAIAVNERRPPGSLGRAAANEPGQLGPGALQVVVTRRRGPGRPAFRPGGRPRLGCPRPCHAPAD
eukprot:9522165-Lingulodinium_polyedra.AAC.1